MCSLQDSQTINRDLDDDSWNIEDGAVFKEWSVSESDESPGAVTKRQILHELRDCKRRLNGYLRRWEKCTSTYPGHIEGNLDEHLFPKGIGFFLMSQFQTHEEEHIKNIREKIMSIGSLEIQDGLLSFLNDYMTQTRLLRESSNRREEVLCQVMDWMETDCAEFKGLKDAGLEEAMSSERKLSENYLHTISVMEKLAAIRRQIGLLDRTKKTPTVGSQDSGEWSTFDKDEEEESQEAMYKGSIRPAEDLLAMVHNVKDESNSELMTAIENKLNDLTSVLSSRDSDIKEARVNIRSKQNEQERLLTEIENTRLYNVQLSDQVRELRAQKEGTVKVKKILDSVEVGRLNRTNTVYLEDFSCQVNFEVLQKDKTEKLRKLSSEPDLSKKTKSPHDLKRPKSERTGHKTETKQTASSLAPDAVPKKRSQAHTKKVTLSTSSSLDATSTSSATQVSQSPSPSDKSQAGRKLARKPDKPGNKPQRPSSAPGGPKELDVEAVVETPSKSVLMQLAGPVDDASVDAPKSPKAASEPRRRNKSIVEAPKSRKTSVESPTPRKPSSELLKPKKPSSESLKPKKPSSEVVKSSPKKSLGTKKRNTAVARLSQDVTKLELSSLWEDRGKKSNHSISKELVETSESEVDLSLAIPNDQLTQLLQAHIKNMLAIAEPFLNELMALRRNARTEIQRIRDRETVMSSMEKQITAFVLNTSADRDNLPCIELSNDQSNVVVSNRHPEPHKCPMCVCHLTTTSTVNLAQLKSPLLLKYTLEASRDYNQLMDDIRETFSEVCRLLAKAQSTIQKLMSQLVWGELGTSDYNNLDEDFDSEMIWVLKTAQRTPLSLPDLLKHALFVTNTVRLIVRDTVAILQHARIRINDLKQQNKQLNELQEFISQARYAMDGTALKLIRHRAGKDLLRNEVVLGVSKCPCCRCYHSAEDDGTRSNTGSDSVTINKLMLTKNMALLQQALGSVLRQSDDPATMLSGVSAQVIEGVQETQIKLSEALDRMGRRAARESVADTIVEEDPSTSTD